MRFHALVMIAGTVAIASPALAQNAAEPATNEMAPAENMAAGNEVTVDTNVINETALPVAEPAAPPEAAPAPTAPAKRSFPWGVLGLLGLIGLFGKRSRTG
jgi:hypothetical protein